MRVIEEAIIIEVNEKEPDFGVETVVPEIIKPKKRKQRSSGIFGSLLDMFITDPFEQILDDLGIFNDIEPEQEETETIQKESNPRPELALITASDERHVREFRYFYYEIEAQ